MKVAVASSGCNGTSTTCISPLYLSRKNLQQAQIQVPLSQSLVAAHATLQGNVSLPRPFSTPGGEHSLRATALQGALEPKLSGCSTRSTQQRRRRSGTLALLGQWTDGSFSELFCHLTALSSPSPSPPQDPADQKVAKMTPGIS